MGLAHVRHFALQALKSAYLVDGHFFAMIRGEKMDIDEIRFLY